MIVSCHFQVGGEPGHVMTPLPSLTKGQTKEAVVTNRESSARTIIGKAGELDFPSLIIVQLQEMPKRMTKWVFQVAVESVCP